MNIFNINKNKLGLLFVLISGAVCGIVGGVFWGVAHDLPQIRSLKTFRPSAVTRVYSAERVLLAEFFAERRDPVPFEKIPDYLKQAIIATEDRNFYQHSGIDLKGIARALARDIKERKFVEGASTITQQLAKTLFLTRKKTVVRKLKEAILAIQLERRFTKNEILELYLNQVYFGSGAYGIESAARIFFGKSVDELTLAECALVAGMPKSPSRYSPLINSDLAIKRRNIVLRQMAGGGIISEQDYHEAHHEALALSNQKRKSVKAPYFVEYIKNFLEDIVGSSRLYKGGLTIFTTLSYELQEVAEQAAAARLLELEARMKAGNIETSDVNCALVSLDVASGGILAMVGGKDFYKSPFNRATSAKRQPGSAFKPIVYAYAVEQGFGQNMMILDAPVAFKGPKKGASWKPENFSKNYSGEMTLRQALAKSKNIPAVRLIEMLGASSVVQFAHNFGIESPLAPYLSLALGSSELTLLELTAAYAVFPNKGNGIKPFGVTEVLDHAGRSVWQAKPLKKIVMTREGAAVMVNMLEAVVKEGTGRKANSIKHPVAGKTGTTNEYKDALFIGFSPSVATGVWVGRDVFATLGQWETGAKAALPVWIDFMQEAVSKKPFQYFDIPDGVIRARMDPATGLLAADDAPDAMTAIFKKGTEPGKYKK